jgi:hypothetical protein
MQRGKVAHKLQDTLLSPDDCCRRAGLLRSCANALQETCADVFPEALASEGQRSLINRPVTVRTIPRFWHPRTGIIAFLLLLSTTTELVVLNPIPQHDPQPDPKFASRGHARLPQTFLNSFAEVKTLQLRIAWQLRSA